MRYFIASLITTMFFAIPSLASKPVPTLKIDRPQNQPRGLVIIAPAKKYLMQERLFTQLADRLVHAGFVIVRFNWASDTLEKPDEELMKAKRDLQFVLQQAQKKFGFGSGATVVISKSFSSKAIEPVFALARSHILFTPNCSTETPFQETYGEFLQQNERAVAVIISTADPFCEIGEVYTNFSKASTKHTLLTTHGDHSFVVPAKLKGKPDSFKFQDHVIQLTTSLIEAEFQDEPVL